MLSLEKIKVRVLTPREPKMILPLILTTHLWLTTTPTAFGIELLNSTRFKQSAAFLPTVDHNGATEEDAPQGYGVQAMTVFPINEKNSSDGGQP